MTVTLFDFGAFRVEAKYIQLKNNTWYFRRRIPSDLRKKYPSRNDCILFSLKTNDSKVAAQKAHEYALRLDRQWEVWRSGSNVPSEDQRAFGEAMLAKFGLRPGDGLVPHRSEASIVDEFEDYLRYESQAETLERARQRGTIPGHVDHAAKLFYGEKVVPLLSEAVAFYQDRTGNDDTDAKKRDRALAIKCLTDVAGDQPVDQYTRENANDVVSGLLDRGNSPNTVSRKVKRISAVVSHCIRENDLSSANPFERLSIPNLGRAAQNEREPFSESEIKSLQKLSRERDDSLRWALAMASDTGMRVAEVIGLRVADLKLDGPIPYVSIQPFDGRTLKTKASKRDVPLVGGSLWAAQRIRQQVSGELAFPKYWRDGELKATHASNALNKWIKAQGIPKSMHSFRHSFRDRLRNADVEGEVADALGGWSTSGVGRGYGRGFSLQALHSYLLRIEL